MRPTIWFVLLFVVAVVAAATLGTNDGLVTFYWGGWRLDLSLNLFLLLLFGTSFLLVLLFQAVTSLTGLPKRAREWRVARRDRTAQALLRDSLAQYFGGRYSRAQKSAQRALVLQADTPELAQDNEFTVLSHLLFAGSAHRLQDRSVRDEELRKALELSSRNVLARSAEEGARLLAAEWALDDRDAPRALELLDALPTGLARRTHALRLRLQAAKLGGQPHDALKTARLLVKHQGFSKIAAQGLLRSLASESLAQAHDLDQLRRTWLLFDAADRRDPFVAACAASRAVELQAPEEGRAWLRPLWDQIGELADDERVVIAESFVQAVHGLGPDWLPRLEAALQAFPRDGAIALAAGIGLADRQLWGKARRLLDQASSDTRLASPLRRRAWVALAQLAAQDGDAARAAECYEAAARLPDRR
ncbi:MAG: heme biosynthesis HemY N-terminal domain-containing protein [Caldimonas sp.]